MTANGWRRATWTVAMMLCVHGSIGCSDEAVAPGAAIGWEEFKAAATKRVELDGAVREVYVVDGDLPVTLDELRAEYEEYAVRPGRNALPSTVNVNGGAIDIWHGHQEQSLTYCVSDEFGATKARAVREMAEASVAWETAADVRFIYVSAHDANCNNGNANVLFSVRPWSSGGACAFFPSGDACVPRTVVVDYPDIDGGFAGAPNVRSLGVLRHELGHVLGLRHEQNRPPGNFCHEDDSWAATTDYDQRSVMHYPWCDGNAASDLSLTTFDRQGVRKLYGAPSVVRDVRIDRVDIDGNGRADAALTGPNGWWTLPVAFSLGGGAFSVTNLAIANFAAWSATGGVEVLRGDFNGDGRTDLALTGPFDWTTLPVAFSNGNGTFNVTNAGVGSFALWATGEGVEVLAGDFNVDGRTDIALTGEPGWTTIPVAFSNGDGTFAIANTGVGAFGGWSASDRAEPVAGDFNGDGRTDVALTGQPGWTTLPVAFSTGGAFSVTNVGIANFAAWSATGARPLAGDFNGDGRSDIALTGPMGWSTIPVAHSNGNGSFAVTNGGVGSFADWAATGGVWLK